MKVVLWPDLPFPRRDGRESLGVCTPCVAKEGNGINIASFAVDHHKYDGGGRSFSKKWQTQQSGKR